MMWLLVLLVPADKIIFDHSPVSLVIRIVICEELCLGLDLRIGQNDLRSIESEVSLIKGYSFHVLTKAE